MKLLCGLASSEKDRKLIRVTASSGLSVSQSKAKFGIENISTEQEAVFAAIHELKSIRDAVEELAICKQSALTEDALQTSEVDSSSNSDTDSSSSCSEDSILQGSSETSNMTPTYEELVILLKRNKCSWVSFVSKYIC